MKGIRDKLLQNVCREMGVVAFCFQMLPAGQAVMHNADKEFRAASMIKLAVMAEVFRRFENGSLNPDDEIVVGPDDKVGGDGIVKELDPDHPLSLRELVTLMIIVSDNTAANLLIDLVGMESVNRLAEDLGMVSTRLRRLMMDSRAAAAGRENTTSAADLMIFFQKLYDLELAGSKEMLDILQRQQVRGRLEKYLPEDMKIAFKTGDLDRLEHAGGIFFTPDTDYILIVLTEDVPNVEGQELIARISRDAYGSVSP